MSLFNKKFKARVAYYSQCKYTVDYAYYRFIPNWRPLCFWFDQGHPGGTECWSKELWDVQQAEEIASELKSINDVIKYYEPLNQQEATWRKREKEYWKKNAPYVKKEF